MPKRVLAIEDNLSNMILISRVVEAEGYTLLQAEDGVSALDLLADPTAAEKDVLGAIRYQQNETVLHTDHSLLPSRRLAWRLGTITSSSRPRNAWR